MQVKKIFYLFFSLFSLIHILLALFILSQDEVFFESLRGLTESIGSVNWLLLAKILLIGGVSLILMNTFLYRQKAKSKDYYIPIMFLMCALMVLTESYIFNLIQ